MQGGAGTEGGVGGWGGDERRYGQPASGHCPDTFKQNSQCSFSPSPLLHSHYSILTNLQVCTDKERQKERDRLKKQSQAAQ